MRGFRIHAAWILLLTMVIFLGFCTFTFVHKHVTGKEKNAIRFNRGMMGAVAAPSLRMLSIDGDVLLEPENPHMFEPESIPEPESEIDYVPEESAPELEPETSLPENAPEEIHPANEPEDFEPYGNDNAAVILELQCIRQGVTSILACLMLCMSAGIVALIIRIVFPLFRGGR